MPGALGAVCLAQPANCPCARVLVGAKAEHHIKA